ncbi:MAG: sulfotransferase [Gammaproteobacteria bacterium]|nr:sulfotransferase [Gammaproteobacteria bacterium]
MIVSLRNPIDRAYSHYWNLYAAAPEGDVNKRLSFEEKLEFTPRLIEEGFYDRKLSNYYTLFPKENILVVIFEEMMADQARHYRRIYEFLGIDLGVVPPLLDVRINAAASKLGRSKLLDLSYKALYRLVRLPSLSRRIDNFNAKKLPEMSAATRDNLRQKLAPSAANLERMLDRNINEWSL